MNAALYVATAEVATSNGSKYLQQLCKHWSHSLKVTFTAEHGAIVFPKDGRYTTGYNQCNRWAKAGFWLRVSETVVARQTLTK